MTVRWPTAGEVILFSAGTPSGFPKYAPMPAVLMEEPQVKATQGVFCKTAPNGYLSRGAAMPIVNDPRVISSSGQHSDRPRLFGVRSDVPPPSRSYPTATLPVAALGGLGAEPRSQP